MSYYYEGIEENGFTHTKNEAILFDLIDELRHWGLTPERCEDMKEFEDYFFELIPIMSDEEQETFWKFHCIFTQERLRLLNRGPDDDNTAA